MSAFNEKYNKRKKPFTNDSDWAFKTYMGGVRCGDCRVYYSGVSYSICPNCGCIEKEKIKHSTLYNYN